MIFVYVLILVAIDISTYLSPIDTTIPPKIEGSIFFVNRIFSPFFVKADSAVWSSFSLASSKGWNKQMVIFSVKLYAIEIVHENGACKAGYKENYSICVPILCWRLFPGLMWILLYLLLMVRDVKNKVNINLHKSIIPLTVYAERTGS